KKKGRRPLTRDGGRPGKRRRPLPIRIRKRQRNCRVGQDSASPAAPWTGDSGNAPRSAVTAFDLAVLYEGERVGTITAVDGDRISFTYAESWLDDAHAFPISLTLPLATPAYPPSLAHAFFANLLPEGQVRIAIAQRLKLSEANDYAMLRALGGDC